MRKCKSLRKNKRKKRAICQQPFQEMAKNVQNSHFSFARIFILAESTQLRSSPLLEAAER
jgi:hypothetical protein